MKLSKALTCFLLASTLSACSAISAAQSFAVSRWKTASKDERRRMAKSFLSQYTTKGMTLDQLKELLGDPDFETDIWTYHLSTNGAPPPGPQSINLFLQYPQLYAHFKEDKVDELSVTYQLNLSDDLSFDAGRWKSNEPNVRLKMAANLIASRIMIGLRKPDAKLILGTPDSESKKRVVSYDLGLRMVDMVTLDFTLDEGGRVLEARIHED
jgi:hypothetical protein